MKTLINALMLIAIITMAHANESLTASADTSKIRLYLATTEDSNMHQFKITFNVYFDDGLMENDSTMNGLQTVISAPSQLAAEQMIKAQYNRKIIIVSIYQLD